MMDEGLGFLFKETRRSVTDLGYAPMSKLETGMVYCRAWVVWSAIHLQKHLKAQAEAGSSQRKHGISQWGRVGVESVCVLGRGNLIFQS